MSAMGTKVQSIKDSFVANQKTIIATVIVLIVWHFIDSASILIVLNFFFSIWEWVKSSSDNQTVGAAAGASFATIGIWVINTRERQKNEEKEELRAQKEKEEKNQCTLLNMSFMCEEYLYLISRIIEIVDGQIKGMDNRKLPFCETEPLLYLKDLDYNLILQIRDVQLRKDLFKIKKNVIGINYNSRVLNHDLASKGTIEDDCLIVEGTRWNIDKQIAAYKGMKKSGEAAQSFVALVKKRIDAEIK